MKLFLCQGKIDLCYATFKTEHSGTQKQTYRLAVFYFFIDILQDGTAILSDFHRVPLFFYQE